MTTSLMRPLVAATFVLFAAVACSGAPPQWTFAPASAPAADTTEASLPAGSPNPALGDAAPHEASPVLESGAPTRTTAPPPSQGPAASLAQAASASAAASLTPEASSAPAGSGTPTGSEAPSGSGAPAGEARVVEIQATGQLSFTTPDGEKISDIPVTPGETVLFRVDNTAGFDHNFHIGTDAELSVPNASDMTGIPTWSSGVQELQWVVPDDVSNLKFGCTVPGHYAQMQGTFTAAS